MTVCAAAIFNNSSIIGASDRMIGMADIQYQPAQPKIWQVTNSIVAMVASNDTGLQYEIHQEVVRVVNERIVSNPTDWWKVKDVADLYRRFYQQARLRRMEDNVFHPNGLDRGTFYKQQKEFSDEFVREILSKLADFQMPNTSILLAGNDGQPPIGIPHLYTIQNGEIACHDVTGFVAIGSGWWHAMSQFMFDEYTKTKDAATALFNVFWAKKRSEVAQGIGPITDMFTLGPALGSFTFIKESVIEDLEKIYHKRSSSQTKLNRTSKDAVQKYVDSLNKGGTEPQAPSPPSPTTP